MMISELKVLRTGLHPSIQSKAHYGYQKWGLSPGGPMDIYHAKIANKLVGNAPDDDLIEVSHLGIELEVSDKSLISISGLGAEIYINNNIIEINKAFQVNRNDTVRITKLAQGNWAYIAISGKLISTKNIYEELPLLKKSDLIRYIANYYSVPLYKPSINKNMDRPIRIILGPEHKILTKGEWKILLTRPYHPLPESNRMALKVKSNINFFSRDTNITSSGVVDGTVQLLPDGSLVILMRDRQTTGGYARIGTVHASDISRLSQITTKQSIYFELYDI